jgi:hypothetical protein
VTAEQYLGYSSHDAVLAQTLWLNNGVWSEDSVVPSVLERQLKINSKLGNAPELLDVLRKQLLKDLCLGVDPDIEWEALPSETRHYLINRCVGISTSVPEEQKPIFADKLKVPSGVSLETYIARYNYAAFISAISLSRATAWVTGDFSSRLHELTRVASLPVLPVIDLHENTATPPKYSVYDRIRVCTGIIYHYLGKLCKFFSIAFVADPEYQREVRHGFPGAAHPGNFLVRGVLIGIWMWSKSVQQFLLPILLVSTSSPSPIHIPILFRMLRYVSSTNERMWPRHGRTSRGCRLLSNDAES